MHVLINLWLGSRLTSLPGDAQPRCSQHRRGAPPYFGCFPSVVPMVGAMRLSTLFPWCSHSQATITVEGAVLATPALGRVPSLVSALVHPFSRLVAGEVLGGWSPASERLPVPSG